MAQTKTEIQSLLAGAGTEPRYRFGQNFMIDQNLVRLVAAAGQVAAGDTVIEIGPGTGTLTEELLATVARRVVAQLLADVEILRTLPPQAFWPAPKIDSALVRMIRRDQVGAQAREFGRFVQKIFSLRRKTLRKAMTMAGWPAEQMLAQSKMD